MSDDARRRMTVRYLDTNSVRAALPPPGQLADLAEVALRALVRGADVPEKAALHATGTGIFAHAMPARLKAAEVPGGGAQGDLLGIKWIAGGPRNRAAGFPAMASLIILNDPSTGQPVAILDGDVITSSRTAALSGVAVRLFGPRTAGDAPARVLLVGAGMQGHAHAEMLGALLPGVRIVVHDRHADRAEALASAARRMEGVGEADTAADPLEAARGVDVIVSATSLADSDPVLGPEHVAPGVLLIPVDYGAWVRPDLVAAAGTFVVDDRERFASNRSSGRLAGWPDPDATLGEVLAGPSGLDGHRQKGLTVVLHQGPGVVDLIVADAVLQRARAVGAGVDLPR